MTRVPLTIIGGGAVGCALADELSKTIEGIVLLERNLRIPGENQSSRNLGVVHTGIYYDHRVMPLKAELCPQGNELLYQECPILGVPIRKTGKLIMIVDKLSEEYAEDTLRIARENGVPGVERISMGRARELEPNADGIGALHVPSSGIVDAAALVKALAGRAEERGATFLRGNKVLDINPQEGYFEVTTLASGKDNSKTDHPETFETDLIINAAGLYADEIARMVDPASPYEIVPTRGEAAKFYDTRRAEISMKGLNVYPAPYAYDNHTGERLRVSLAKANWLVAEGKATKTVGIHLTPTFDEQGQISNTVTIGPAKTVGIGKEDYGSGLKPPAYYHERIKDILPGLREEEIQLHQTGIMAVLKGHPDWVMERDQRHQGMINLIGIDSPGITSIFSIVQYVKNNFV